MKLIVAGGRDFNDYSLLSKSIHNIINNYQSQVEIVSGGARGADKLGEEFAASLGLPVKRFPAEWDKHGKVAGVLRNIEMAKYADTLIAFWDGKSRGTANMITEARHRNLRIYIIRY